MNSEPRIPGKKDDWADKEDEKMFARINKRKKPDEWRRIHESRVESNK